MDKREPPGQLTEAVPESTFATVRLRQRVTKSPGSRAAGVAMAFKLIERSDESEGGDQLVA